MKLPSFFFIALTFIIIELAINIRMCLGCSIGGSSKVSQGQ